MVSSVLITPLLLLVYYAFLKVAIKIGVVGIAPVSAETFLDALFRFISSTPHSIVEFVRSIGPSPPPFEFALLVRLPILLLLFTLLLLLFAGPSLVVGALIWRSLRRLLLRAAEVDLIQRINARPARADNLKERQLLNIVEEVAIGSGAEAPRAFVIDTPTVNAAALGNTPDKAALLVTSGLLERLDRDETEATVARLVTGLIAGDLHVASGMMATFHTFYVFWTMFNLPFRFSAWIALGRIARLIMAPRPGTKAVADAVASLEEAAGRLILFPPFYQATTILWAAPLILSMSGLWHNRFFWSDAQSVKLTRDPDALARTLQKIGVADPPPGAETYDWLFIAKPCAQQERDALESTDGKVQLVGDDPARRLATGRQLNSLDQTGARGTPSGKIDVGFEVEVRSPKIKARVDRLLAMGSGLPRTSIWSRITANPESVAEAVLLVPLLALLAFLVSILVPLMLILTAVIMGIGGCGGFLLLYGGMSLLDYLMG